MKTDVSLIDFFNLGELATECFLQALSLSERQTQQRKSQKDQAFESIVLERYMGKTVALCVTVEKEQSQEIFEKLHLDKSIVDDRFPNHIAIIIDRITVSEQRRERIRQAKEVAMIANLEPTIYLKDEADKEKNIWTSQDISYLDSAAQFSTEESDENLSALSWDEVFERFSKPQRYHQFQNIVESRFGFKLSEKTTLKSFLIAIEKLYEQKKSQLKMLLEYCEEFADIGALSTCTPLHKLPRKVVNILIGIKALLLKETNDSFVIDGPLPESLRARLHAPKQNIQVTHVNSDVVDFYWGSFPKAEPTPQTWILHLPNSALCYGTIAEYFGMNEEIRRFYRMLPTALYRGVAKEDVLQLKIKDFFNLFGNHPKFRGLASVWKQMNLDNFSLTQQLDELSYPDALLMTIAKSAARIREDTIMTLPNLFEGISAAQVKTHIAPLIDWCERHRCRVY